tara:strand:- start:404 stop:2131 length:1728 start_codon:yes stop_codon:yes gene_type:complete
MSYRILGFSLAHDASVCVICDGELEYFGKEERYTREKRDKQPFMAVEKALEAAKGPIDVAVLQSPTHNPSCSDVFRCFICKKVGLNPDTQWIDMTSEHHLAHAFNAYNNSGFDGTALTFVIDRDGSQIFDPLDGNIQVNDDGSTDVKHIGRECESVYLMKQPASYKALHKAFWMRNATFVRSKGHDKSGLNAGWNSLARHLKSKYVCDDISIRSGYGITKVYESATTMIGEGPLENGKTMGLASYGRPKDFPPLFFGSTPIDQFLCHEGWVVGVASLQNKILEKVTRENFQPYADWALHVQKETQQAVNYLVQKYVAKSGVKDVIMTGGYSLNVVANNYLIEQNPDVNFYFEPNADDTGNSLGASLFVHKLNTQDSKRLVLNDTFYHSLEPQEPLTKGESSTPRDIADLLASGRSVALYEGQPEAGPRALGHRSILFDPRKPDARDKVNLIKKREWYRPFAGIILEEYFEEYFETLGLKSSPNMTVNFKAKQKALDECPGIIHVDNTCRMQTVNSGYMCEVLREFLNDTGVPVLMNTSFNMAGDPLVHTYEDALQTLDNSMLDYVYFVDEDKLVR